MSTHEDTDRHTGDRSAAWEAYHRRSRALRDIVTLLEESAGRAPLVDPSGVFTDEADLLRELHGLWTRRLMARVELAMDLGEDLPAESVARAWREMSADLPGVRRVLDAHAAHPALAHAQRHQNRMLALAAGYVSVDDPTEHAAAIGARLLIRVRALAPVPRGPRLRWPGGEDRVAT